MGSEPIVFLHRVGCSEELNLKNESVSEFQPVQRGSCHEDSEPMIIQKGACPGGVGE